MVTEMSGVQFRLHQMSNFKSKFTKLDEAQGQVY